MNTRLWRLLPATLVLLGCNDSEANPFPGPLDQGKEECKKYLAFPSQASTACVSCLHAECAPAWQTMSLVCAGDPSDRCKADGGGALPIDSFCECMVSLPKGCGPSVGSLYSCFANECAKACGADGGAAGAGGKGGSGGAGGYKDAGGN